MCIGPNLKNQLRRIVVLRLISFSPNRECVVIQFHVVSLSRLGWRHTVT